MRNRLKHEANRMSSAMNTQQSENSSFYRTIMLGVTVTVYVVTAVAQPVLVDTARHTVGSIPPLLPQLCMTSAMALTGLVPCVRCCFSTSRCPSVNQFSVSSALLCGALDILSGQLLYAGLLQVGGAVFAVIYSSCTAWTALLSWWNGEELHKQQWLGVVLVTVGLLLNGAANRSEHTEQDSQAVLSGSLLCLAGSVLHSLFVVVLNNRLRDRAMQFTPLELCGVMGVVETAALLALGFASRATAGTDLPQSKMLLVVPAFAALVCSNWLHAISFFEVLHSSGPVVAGLLKAVQTVCVFVLSSLLFCDASEATQCMTPAKVVSVVVLICGLVSYGCGSAIMRLGAPQNETSTPKDEAVEVQVSLMRTANENS